MTQRRRGNTVAEGLLRRWRVGGDTREERQQEKEEEETSREPENEFRLEEAKAKEDSSNTLVTKEIFTLWSLNVGGWRSKAVQVTALL